MKTDKRTTKGDTMKYALMIALLTLTACGRGPAGLPGKDGQSIQGERGEAGEDAEVSIVKLCPGVTTYPTRFVEIAFCFDGRLYGTYSANGGFSTELPPGNYTSNGIGSSCNFRVLPNCVIQN